MHEIEEQWLTGFWEGDGLFGLYVHNGHYQPQLGFYQKDRGVLDYVQTLLGFGRVRPCNYNTLYTLTIYSRERCVKLLAMFCKYVVSKQTIAKMEISAQQHEPSMSWIVGFFDAEGGVDWDNHGEMQLSISQKEREVLEKIQAYVGGRIYGDGAYWKLRPLGCNLRSFIPSILEFSHNELKRQRLITMLYVLARNDGVWGSWARELIGKGSYDEEEMV